MRVAHITAFRQDDERHWIADLSCGHSQHMRHQPPWQVRPWVLTAEGRAAFVGVEIRCPLCADESPRDGGGVEEAETTKGQA